MKQDGRLSVALHVLLHLAGREAPMTSEELAACSGRNAVVIRRTLKGLREMGLVRAERGPGGGWTLGKELAEVNLFDVHAALGAPSFFGVAFEGVSEGCLVVAAVDAALGGAFEDANALLLRRLKEISLADLVADFRRRFQRHVQKGTHRHHARRHHPRG